LARNRCNEKLTAKPEHYVKPAAAAAVPPAPTPPGATADRAAELRADGQTVMHVAIDGVLGGLLGMADPIKETTHDALRALKAEGLRVVVMTGDSNVRRTRSRSGSVSMR
jgi:P-type E1-E2 ATPase